MNPLYDVASKFSTMRYHAIDLHNGEYTQPSNTYKKGFLLTLTLVLLITIPLYLSSSSTSPLPSPKSNGGDSKSTENQEQCPIFVGNWAPYPDGPAYYTNETCNLIIDQQNCMKFGRPDTEFMKWRWKPDDCALPLFDAAQFLELVRGRSLAFLGDSVGRNQMQSLLCLLANVTYPEDISRTSDTDYFKRYVYHDYNFTLANLWSPFLVKSRDADPNGHDFDSLMSLYLDEPDEAWLTQVEQFDYVIVSVGQWFFRPLIYYESGQVIGCHKCPRDNMTAFVTSYGYKKAFRTVFRTLQNLKNYKGVTFLRTFSPSHFENGAWNEGGNCVRTRPFSKEEIKLDGYVLEMYSSQVKELKAAKKQGVKTRRGLQFRLMDTTEAMLLRPDGHPNFYGHSPHRNMTLADCVHWCLPGPIDMWNEILLHMLKTEQRPA